MIPQLKAEVKKVLTVRSTYAISLFFLILIGVLSVYAQGYKTRQADINNHFLLHSLGDVANTLSVAGALIALLLMAHEYRYNTITYTLTAANSRSKVLAAKILTILGFVLIFSCVGVLLSLSLSRLGVAIAGHTMPHQDINYFNYLIKVVFTCEAYALVALLIPTIVRNMQASVAILFIVPNTLEALLSIIIKQPEKWLPFRALGQVTQQPVEIHGGKGGLLVSPLRGALIFLVYLIIGWAIGWYLFLRRDAT
jgi:ABC-2 type transport system permease protein